MMYVHVFLNWFNYNHNFLFTIAGPQGQTGFGEGVCFNTVRTCSALEHFLLDGKIEIHLVNLNMPSA